MAKVTKLDALNTVLASLSASSGDIEACAVVSIDGLMMASNFPAGFDEERMGAMTAALLALGERTSNELNRGDLEQVFVRGKNGMVVMMGAGHEGVLTALCSKNAKLGLIFLDMHRASEEISKVI